MTVISSGFEIQRASDILTQTEGDIQDAYGGGIDLSTDSIFGCLYSVASRGHALAWEFAQGVYDSVGLYTAEGSMLDNAALLVGFVRNPASRTRGEVLVTAHSGTVIPKGGVFTSVVGDGFTAVQEQIIAPTFCRGTRLYVNTLSANTLYSLSVNNNQYTYTASAAPTKSEILLQFQTMLLAEGTLSVLYNEQEVGNPYLDIEVDGVDSVAMSGTSFFTFDYVKTRVLVESVNTGAIPAKAGTINKLTDPVLSTIYQVGNLTDLPEGKAVESDFSFRRRVINAYRTIAGGTPDSVHANVSAVTGVESVKVIENRSSNTLPSGQPPWSFRTVVYGGTDLDVAEAIWRSKGAATHTWTDRTNTQRRVVQEIFDYNSQSHYVQFTRPEVQYIWVKVKYSKYSEEAFTSGGEEIMKQVVESTGDSLGIGNDVIPKRFVGPIYRNVSGLSDVTVSIAVTSDLNTTPLPGDYQTSRYPISDEQITNFSTQRVIVIDNTP